MVIVPVMLLDCSSPTNSSERPAAAAADDDDDPKVALAKRLPRLSAAWPNKPLMGDLLRPYDRLLLAHPIRAC